MQRKIWTVLGVAVVLATVLALGTASAQSVAALGTGFRFMQHQARNRGTDLATMGIVGQPGGASVFLGSRYGLHVSAEFVRPYLAWVDGEFLESGAGRYGLGASVGAAMRHNLSERRFVLAGVGLAASALSLEYQDELRSAFSNWGPAAHAAVFFRTRHNIYSFLGGGLSYHPEFNPVGSTRYKEGFSGGIQVGIAAAAQPRRRRLP